MKHTIEYYNKRYNRKQLFNELICELQGNIKILVTKYINLKESNIICEHNTNSVNVIVNKGTGAGGYKTNYYGKKFEEKNG